MFAKRRCKIVAGYRPPTNPGERGARLKQRARSEVWHNGQSPAIRRFCKYSALADCCAFSGSIYNRLVNAGHPWRSSWQCFDTPYFVRCYYPLTDYDSFCLADHSSRGAGEFAAALATSYFRGGALVAVRASFRYHDYRLAVRFIPRLICFLLLSGPVADAGGKRRHRWALLITISIHIAATLAHIFIYRDRIMQRMWLSR